MIPSLIVILILTLALPILSKKAEQNLEAFLLIMGLSASIVSGILSKELFVHIFHNEFMYMITGAVFIGGVLFKVFNRKLSSFVQLLTNHISIELFVFLTIVILGLVSSIITAIISSLLLVEILNVLPVSRKVRIKINIIACFSIGLGASLTPIGEPLSTVIISKLNVGFLYLLQQFGLLIFSGIVLLGLLGMFYTVRNGGNVEKDVNRAVEEETLKIILIRSVKVFIFIIALELLGSGYKPIIDSYVIRLDSHLLYWTNMISAVLDNATLATAEISAQMSYIQIKSVLMGLLISGGMMIPGNIPNIISADKLKIKSSEWIKLGVPVGLVMMTAYYFVLFR